MPPMRTPVALLIVALAFPLCSVARAADTSVAAISKDRAKKLAKAGVLTKTDLKGWTQEAAESDPDDAADTKAYYKCLGAKVPTYLAKNKGYSYSKDPVIIDSSAQVVSSVTAANADLKAIKSSKAPACYEKQLTVAIERAGAKVKSMSVKAVTVSVKGADGAHAFQIKAVLDFGDQLATLNGYDLSVLVGQTEIAVSPGRYDGKSPTLKQSTDLAAVATKRVRAG